MIVLLLVALASGASWGVRIGYWAKNSVKVSGLMLNPYRGARYGAIEGHSPFGGSTEIR